MFHVTARRVKNKDWLGREKCAALVGYIYIYISFVDVFSQGKYRAGW
jgi:hypothetical protein